VRNQGKARINLFRRAVQDEIITQKEFDEWRNAATLKGATNRSRAKFQTVAAAEERTRRSIEDKMEAGRDTRIEAAVAETLMVSNETKDEVVAMRAELQEANERVKKLEAIAEEDHRLLVELHSVGVLGQTAGGSGVARIAQIRTAKAGLTNQAASAREDAKDENLKVMEKRIQNFEELANASDDARRQIVGDTDGIGELLRPLMRKTRGAQSAAVATGATDGAEGSVAVEVATGATDGVGEEDGAELTQASAKSMNLIQLRARLRAAGKRTGGNKPDLIARLLALDVD